MFFYFIFHAPARPTVMMLQPLPSILRLPDQLTGEQIARMLTLPPSPRCAPTATIGQNPDEVKSI